MERQRKRIIKMELFGVSEREAMPLWDLELGLEGASKALRMIDTDMINNILMTFGVGYDYDATTDFHKLTTVENITCLRILGWMMCESSYAECTYGRWLKLFVTDRASAIERLYRGYMKLLFRIVPGRFEGSRFKGMFSTNLEAELSCATISLTSVMSCVAPLLKYRHFNARYDLALKSAKQRSPVDLSTLNKCGSFVAMLLDGYSMVLHQYPPKMIKSIIIDGIGREKAEENIGVKLPKNTKNTKEILSLL